MIKRSLLVLLAVFACAHALPAQVDTLADPSRCAAVPDTVKPPTPAQVRERARLRDRVAAAFRADGHPAAGLLYVDIDSTRRGKLVFLQLDLPAETRQRAMREVADHLQTLESGRTYHAVIRIDGDYPVIAPGKQQCTPELDNSGDMVEMRRRLMLQHPLARTLEEPRTIRATLILVIDRGGKVAWAGLEAPTGDEFVDEYADDLAYELRFLPASLDGVPFDSRLRFTLSFPLH